MSTLHVLMPPAAHAGLDAEFQRWLAHGNRLPDLPNARLAATRELFRFAGDTVAVAALRHHCHAPDAAMGSWLCADPAYVRSETTAARMMACPVEDLSADDAAALADALRPPFGDAGVPLAIDTPSAWCVRLTHGVPLPRFVPPPEALGVTLLECLPEGEAGRTWRRLFNEAQVALHTHPRNDARVAAGKMPVNALWFWGAGSLPGAVATRVAVVASRDDVLRGLAKVAGVVCTEPRQAAIDRTDSDGDALLDLDEFAYPDHASPWLEPFHRWLRTRRFDAIALTFADGKRFLLRRGHRWRFWRRPS